ncbi:MAG: hypothetical protein Q8P32_03185 [Candidatus Komeilibacteria bacterium]|nr:hypothetical protein [Candidatus Komeilibacteria bacterium]
MISNVSKLDKKFTVKQKVFLYLYKSRQYVYNDWLITKDRLIKFVDSFLFYVLVYSIFLFIFQKSLSWLNINVSEEHLYSFGFAVAGIIGASIAIIFSFSTFILQSTADLFSTQYLNKFIQDKKEKYFFWLLVALTIFAFLTPIFIKYSVSEILVTILFVAFYLIYSLYNELRTRINPETTLVKIRNDAVRRLSKVNKELKKHAHIQNKIFEYENENKDLSLAVQYKTNSNWNLLILEDIKYLYEIGLRLLSKNEINSFNLTLKYIHDIYLLHLSLRNGHIIRLPVSFWGTYTFDDEGFTTKVLEYLESMSNRVIQEKRKENIYYLLSVYENLIIISQSIKFADKNIGAQGESPILNIILAYYIGLIEKLADTKENDWIWESVKSVSRISNALLLNNYNYIVYSQINQIINKLTLACISGKQEAFIKEIAGIYLNQIKIVWSKYSSNAIFWKDLFKELKKSTLILSLSGSIGLSVSELYIDFHAWQADVINSIFNLTDKDIQKESLDKYMEFMEKWSDFLLDFSRDEGLENKQVGLPIIQSVENNLRILYGIKHRFDLDLTKIYKTQFNTFSWYFQKIEKIDESFLFNLEQVQEILLREINFNLKEKVFDVKGVINLFIRLVEQHFEKVSVGYGYNHPRVIEKLICLGLVLNKYKVDVADILKLIDQLNAKYLELNKEYFELKKTKPNLMGPVEYQLCKEIYDLENDLFSYNSGMVMGIKQILKQEIDKSNWGDFIGKIKHCEGVEYKTISRF